MPTILRVEGFRFFFWAEDCKEPIHVHVSRGEGLAKVWVGTMTIASSYGFKRQEERRILQLLSENREYVIARWHQFCGDNDDG